MPKKLSEEVQVRLTKENTLGVRAIKRTEFSSIPAIVNKLVHDGLIERERNKLIERKVKERV